MKGRKVMLKSFILSVISGVIAFAGHAFKQVPEAPGKTQAKTREDRMENVSPKDFYPSERTVKVILGRNGSVLKDFEVGGVTGDGTLYRARRLKQNCWKIDLPRDVEDGVLTVFASGKNYGFTRKEIKIEKYRRKYSVNLSETEDSEESVIRHRF